MEVVEKELWEQMIKDLPWPLVHYVGKTESVYVRHDGKPMRVAYSIDGKYYMLKELQEAYTSEIPW